jgi:GNAT superfamily N-acetyltransferase
VSPFSIRFARPEDGATLHRFIVGLAEFVRAPEAVEATPEMLEAQLSDPNPPFECLVAESAGDILGAAFFFANYSTWRGLPGLYLEDLFVPPEHRRKGVGEAIMRRLAQIAEERGCVRIDWAVLDWNDQAKRFYRALGAQPHPSLTMWRVDRAALSALAGSSEA